MTTTFQGPLTSPDYTKLRGTAGNNSWWAKQFITLCKNTLVFAARVNGAISSSSYAQITFDTVTVGAYTDIEQGETFFLSHTSNIRDAYYRGRVRTSATSTILPINETSVNVTDNDYIFVVYDFDIWDVLSRMVSNVQYEDWDIAYQKLPPVVVGLRTAYVNWNPNDGVYHVDFDVSASYGTDQYSSSTISTFQFVFVAGTYTVTSGSLASATVGVDFNANTEQWGYLLIEDSQGTQWIRHFYIRAHGSTDTPSLDFGGVQITGNLDSGWNATVSAWAGVDSVLAQTFTVIWSQEYYNGTLGPLSIANNIDMVGRFHRETNSGRGDALYSYIDDVKFDIEGIATQMQRLEEQDLTTIDKSTATAWDEISFNTPQRSIVHYLARHSTVLHLCDLTFPDGFDLTYLFQYVPNQGGNVLDAVRGIAAQINANVEFAPDGRIQIVRDTRFLSDKSGVVVVANFDNRDFTTLGLGVDPVAKTGRLDAYGISYNAGNVTTCRSRAPGNAQGYAAGQGSLDNQILAATTDQNVAQAELNYRAGQQLAIENLTYTQDWKATTGGYHFLVPSRGQRVTHLLTTATNVRGLSFDTSDYWQVVSISITHDNRTGAREVTTTEELEPPVGDSGDTVPLIAGGTQTNPILLQPLDPFPNLPDDPGNYTPDTPTPPPYPPNIPQQTGNTDIFTDGKNVWVTKNVFVANPAWISVTPSDLGSFTLTTAVFDRTNTNPPLGAYALGNDGTNSAIWHTSDVFATPVNWTKGASFTGVYTEFRVYSTAGSVAAYSHGSLAGATALSYINGSGPASFNFGDTITITAAASVGCPGTYDLGVDLTPCTNIQVLTRTGFTNRSSCSGTGSFTDCNGNISTTGISVTPPLFNGACAEFGYGSNTPFSITIKNNGAITGNATARYSSDYGATVGSAITVGTGPSNAAALDVEIIGAASVASAAGQVKIATSLGGTYSNATGGTLAAGDPVALVLPVRRWDHGARQDSVSNPDYLIMSGIADSGKSVYKVNGATGVQTDITPVSGATGPGPNMVTVWQSSSACKLAVIVLASGQYKLYTSVNSGSSWTFRRVVSSPIFLRCRRNDPYGSQLFLIDGTTLYTSPDWGVTWISRTLPSSNPGVYLDIYN